MTVFETVRQFFPARPRAPAGQVAESLPSVPEASTVEAAVKAIVKHGGPEVENLQFGGDLEAGGQGTVAAVTVTRCEDGGVMLPPRHLLHDAGKAVRRGKGKDADKVEAVMKLTKTKQVHRTWSMQYMLRALMLRALCSSYMPIMLFINVLWRVTATPAMLVAKVSDANVSDANGSDANVSDAKVSDANASDANVSDAKVSDAKDSDANVSDANGSDANGSDANVSDANVSDAKDSSAEQRIIVSTELSPRAHMTLAAFIARAADCVMPVLGEDWLVFWLASPGLPPSMVYWAMRAAVPLLMGGKVLWDSGVIHRDWKPSNVLVTLRFIGELVVGLVVQLADLGYSRPIDFDRKTFTPGQFGTPGFQPVLSLVDTNLLGNLMIADLQLDVMGLVEVVLSMLLNPAVVMDYAACIGPTWLMYASMYGRAQKQGRALPEGDTTTLRAAPLAVLGVELAGSVELLELLEQQEPLKLTEHKELHPPVPENMAGTAHDKRNTSLMLKQLSLPIGDDVIQRPGAARGSQRGAVGAEAAETAVRAAADKAQQEAAAKVTSCGVTSNEEGVRQGLLGCEQSLKVQMEAEQQRKPESSQQQKPEHKNSAKCGACALNTRRYMGFLSFPQPGLHRSRTEAGSTASLVVSLMRKLAARVELRCDAGNDVTWLFPQLDVAAAVEAALGAGKPTAAAASSSSRSGGAGAPAAGQNAELTAAISVAQLLLQLFMFALQLWVWAVEELCGLTEDNLNKMRDMGMSMAAVDAWLEGAKMRAVGTATSLVLLMLDYQHLLHQGKALPLLPRIVGGMRVAEAQQAANKANAAAVAAAAAAKAATDAAAAAGSRQLRRAAAKAKAAAESKHQQAAADARDLAAALSVQQKAAMAMSAVVQRGFQCEEKEPGGLLSPLLKRRPEGGKASSAQPPAAASSAGAGGGAGGSGTASNARAAAGDGRKRPHAGVSSHGGGAGGIGSGGGISGGSNSAGDVQTLLFPGGRDGASDVLDMMPDLSTLAHLEATGVLTAEDVKHLRRIHARLCGPGGASNTAALPVSRPVEAELMRMQKSLQRQSDPQLGRRLRGLFQVCLLTSVDDMLDESEQMQILELISQYLSLGVIGMNVICLHGQRDTAAMQELQPRKRQQPPPLPEGWNLTAGKMLPAEAKAAAARAEAAGAAAPGVAVAVAAADAEAAGGAAAADAEAEAAGAGEAAAGQDEQPPTVGAAGAEPSAASSQHEVMAGASRPQKADRFVQEVQREIAARHLSGSGGPCSNSTGAGSNIRCGSGTGAADTVSSSAATARYTAAVQDCVQALKPRPELASVAGTHLEEALKRLQLTAQPAPQQANPLTQEAADKVCDRLSQLLLLQQHRQQQQEREEEEEEEEGEEEEGGDEGEEERGGDMDVDEQQQQQQQPRRRRRLEEPQ
ncbi:hypothetical protein CHLRE_02g095048v5 [Chlamydomonas reinhardtii]|uniref:Protein kinase domain-containing protein n=1 Tax=Chlamydomonas reinhardtii TaxID=3055 RepID=A0A2K3E1K7_CHLRE|nr:uncharacterized protein CHLRE_02g095048v5 [Chlamydomonas reinhardtii]PNW86659.1 hypothetical protein CHLRE_02g095048v5 [Chlamydomonas reinhardtii]